MKVHKFEVNMWSVAQPNPVIRDKLDIVDFMIDVLRLMTSQKSVDNPETECKIYLCVDSFSRIFYITDKKIFSLSFPFVVFAGGDLLEFALPNSIPVDSKILASVKSMIPEYKSGNFAIDVDLLWETVCDMIDQGVEGVWELLHFLLTFDDGYIRFDHDPAGNVGKGNVHPVNHLDIFYQNRSSFKIGLDDVICVEDFCNILDKKTECHFLRSSAAD